MSNAYNLEPPTKGKVILKTSLGDLEVELWAKEAPKACRNFVQLCLEGYYDNTIFHRIIKDYLVQGGDPSGTGDGSESIYGELFKDEFHSRIKFAHRGLLACANQNRPHSNGSQFFITLEKTDWLDRQNTIFGKVVGDTVYNLLRLGECEADEADRPLDPPVLREVEVVWNPFEDIVPRRNGREAANRVQEEAAAVATKQRSARSSKKQLGLLSFGEEAEEEEQQLERAAAGAGAGARIRSAHDALEDRRLAKDEETPDEERIIVQRPVKRSREEEERAVQALGHTKARLATRAAAEGEAEGLPPAVGGEEQSGGSGRGAGAGTGGTFGTSMHQQMMERRKQMGDAPVPRTDRLKESSQAKGPEEEGRGRGDDDDDDADDAEDGRTEARNASAAGAEDGGGGGGGGGGGSYRELRHERNERIENLRMETKRQGIGRIGAADDVADAELLKPWQLAREQYKQRKKIVGSREKTTLARLAKFSDALKAMDKVKQAPGGRKQDTTRDEGVVNNKDGEGGSAGADAAPPRTADEEAAGYSGKVRTDIDHNTYLPAAWRVDDYLERPDLDASLEDLRSHRLEFKKESGRSDAMARNIHDDDNYLVIDPLLEKGMSSFSKSEQGKKKRQNEWGASKHNTK